MVIFERLRHGFGFDGRRVTPLAYILTLQFITHAFEGGALENLALSKA